MRIATILMGLLLLATGIWSFANSGVTFLALAFVIGLVMIVEGTIEAGIYIYARSGIRQDNNVWMLTDNVITLLTGILVISGQLAADVAALSATLGKLKSIVSGVDGNLADSVYSAGVSLAGSAEALKSSAASMSSSAQEMFDLANRIDAALAASDTDELQAILGSESAQVANMLAAPVNTVRIPVFSAENFGSGMAPLYTAIALFVGNLLIMVLIKPRVSGRCLEDLPKGDYKSRHFVMGRGMTVGLISFIQSTVMALGNLFFLGVQCANPFLYLLTFWVTSFMFISMACCL